MYKNAQSPTRHTITCVCVYIHTHIWGGTPQKTRNLFIKTCVFSLICLNFSHLRSILHLMQYTYQDVFRTAENSSWTHRFWCLLVFLLFFVSFLPHGQNVSLWGLFSSGETKKVTRGKIRWIQGWIGAWRLCWFWSKTAKHLEWCGQVCS